ncbi:flagellar hook-length control protein FliK [Marinomonas dokdonensis]|uniref:flagellar hook-length control protein FliK n=1 Tax=Marinomonas dokdonensis TaxID=328224 RepID=UPI0040556ED1
MRTASNLLLPVSAETPKNLSKSISADSQGQGSFADDLHQAKVDLDLKEQSKISAASSESGTRPSNLKPESTQLSSTPSTSKEVLNGSQTDNAHAVTEQSSQDSESLTVKRSNALAPNESAQLSDSEGVLASSNKVMKPANNLLLSDNVSGNKLQSVGTMAPQVEESAAVSSEAGLLSTLDESTDGSELVSKTLLPSSTQASSLEQAPIDSEGAISVTQSITKAGAAKELANGLPVSEGNSVSKPVVGQEGALVAGQVSKPQAQPINPNSIQKQPSLEVNTAAQGTFQQTPLAEQIDLANTLSQGESAVLRSGVSSSFQAPESVTDVSGDEAKAALLASSAGLTEVVKKQADESVVTGEASPEPETNAAGLSSVKESSNSLLAAQETLPKTIEAASFEASDTLKSSENVPLTASGSVVEVDMTQADTAVSLPIPDNELVDGDKKQSPIDLSQALLASTMKANKVASKADAETEVAKAALSADQNVITSQDTLVEPLAEDGVAWVMSQMQAAQMRPSVSKANNAEGDGLPLPAGVAEKAALESPSTKATLATGGSLLSDGLSELTSEGTAEFEVENEGVLEDFVAKEPVELRKKEQDALITRMSSTVERAANDAGGLGSSLQTGQMAKAAPTALAAGVNSTGTTAQNLAMNLPPQHPGWAGEMTQKVAWVARDGGQTAHIRLDPPELGSLTVKISVDKDAATQVSFVAATPQARDMIEGQMHRLREMLAQQGMELNQVNVDVSQHDASSGQFADAQDQQNNPGAGRSGGLDDADMALATENVSYVSATGVDYYA